MGQLAIAIPEKIFFKIGEVCEIVDVQAHVLRYWETEFPMLSPQKNRSGQRSYRRRDVEIAVRIKELLYEDQYTIAGARKKLQTELRESSRGKVAQAESAQKEISTREAKTLKPVQEQLELYREEYGEADDLKGGQSMELDVEKREALTNLAAQLLELREMLSAKKS
jgi:DNA-binding transcriptional MerR regulator